MKNSKLHKILLISTIVTFSSLVLDRPLELLEIYIDLCTSFSSYPIIILSKFLELIGAICFFLLVPVLFVITMFKFISTVKTKVTTFYIATSLIFYIASTILAFLLISEPRPETVCISCYSKLKQIYNGMIIYAEDNNNSFPECGGFSGFKRLADTGYLTLDPKLYTCPSMHKHYDIVNEETVSYLYISGAKPGDKDKPLVLDKYGNHKHYGNLVYADGQIQTIEGNDWKNLYKSLILEGKVQQGVPGS